ncbi:FecCD family ABC transporter permease [Ornithinibacillus bavariensis]|uniref:FecCD family ABC transporter permease n=1 Tax=Ornithinibacillus bavariensis TaxID=545502 RepID=UPI001BB3A887|nr:iron ABC transporter permease [Ornithinibacillus bavariensis]
MRIMRKRHLFYKTLIILVSFIGALCLSLALGAADISLKSIWLSLTTNGSSETANMLHEIRIPRVIGAMFVGAALSVAGAIMQGLTRNPLADPGLLGLTAGANLALAIGLAFFPALNYFSMMVACFIGAGLGAGLVFGIGATKRAGFSPFRIVLAGAAITAFLTAIADAIGIYFKLSKDISMWTAGGLIGTTWSQLQIIVPIILVGVIVATLFSRQLTILSLHEEVAIGLGQNIMKVKVILFILIIVLTGSAVALAGNMVFLGLMIPHIVRAIVGTDYRVILPISAITGAGFMMLADLMGRTIHAPYETPVAAIVAFLGLPFFLIVVHKGGKAFS